LWDKAYIAKEKKKEEKNTALPGNHPPQASSAQGRGNLDWAIHLSKKGRKIEICGKGNLGPGGKCALKVWAQKGDPVPGAAWEKRTSFIKKGKCGQGPGHKERRLVKKQCVVPGKSRKGRA